MEKICIYRNNAEISRQVAWYKTVADRLQKVADALAEIEIEPTLVKIQSLYEGGDLAVLVNESCKAQGIANVPKRIQSMVRQDTEKDVVRIKAMAASLIGNESHLIKWEFYQVNLGKVHIAPNFVQVIEDENSIFIDTDSRMAVYEKWLAMEKAINDFNLAVKEAPKNNSVYDRVAVVNPNMANLYDANNLMGISIHDRYSLALLNPDGTPTLKASNFEYIK